MRYWFDDWEATGDWILTPTASGLISQVLDLPDAVGQHRLTVEVSGLAGNQHIRHSDFLIRDTAPVLDDDTLPVDSPIQSGNDESQFSNAGGPNYSWGYVGYGGGWGYADSYDPDGWVPGSFAGLNEDSNDPSFDFVGSGNGYGNDDNPTYLAKLDIILREAGEVISTHRSTLATKAALIKRTEMLKAIGQLVDEQYQAALNAGETNLNRFYNALKGVMHGIFDEADRPITTTSGAVKEGYILAQDLVRDSLPQTQLSVKVQTYQATLMGVANKVLDEQNLEWTEPLAQQAAHAFLKLASLYAKFNPTESPNAGADNFLSKLWWVQTSDNSNEIYQRLSESVIALKHLMTGIDSAEEAVRAFTFVTNLLESVANVSDVQEELKDGVFVERLVAFGFKLAGMELDLPTTNTDDTFAGFLKSLWNAPLTEQGSWVTEESATVKAANGLSELLGGVDTVAEGVQRIQFAENLIEAAKLAPSLVEQADDVEFLDALLGLGGTYAELEPRYSVVDGGAGSEDFEFYLDTLWRLQNLSQGSSELEDFMQQFVSSNRKLEALRFQHNLINQLQYMPASELQQSLQDSSFLTLLLDWGAKYVASSDNSDLFVNDLNGFLPLVANTKPYQPILIASSTGLNPAEFGKYILEVGKGAFRYVNVRTLASVVPSSSEVTFQQIMNYMRLILDASQQEKVLDIAQIGFMLGVSNHETLYFTNLVEIGDDPNTNNDFGYEGRVEFMNDVVGDGDAYKGRGFVMITGKLRYFYYTAVKQIKLNGRALDLYTNPDLVANPEVAAKILVDYLKYGKISVTADWVYSGSNTRPRTVKFSNLKTTRQPISQYKFISQGTASMSTEGLNERSVSLQKFADTAEIVNQYSGEAKTQVVDYSMRFYETLKTFSPRKRSR